jgi:hypothetical protein
MRLICATHDLVGPGGTETYLLTVATTLERLGHDVHLYARNQGRMAEVARESGLRVAATLDALPEACDGVISNFGDVAYDLVARYPGVAQLYVCHSVIFSVQWPPQAADEIQRVVVMNDSVGDVVGATANAPEIVRLRQPVDTQRFFPRTALPVQPRRLLLFGNYAAGARRAMVEAVCREAGIELVAAGTTSHPTERPEDPINDSDVVMGYGRCIVEAMACGRAAYVYDHQGGDGWVTPESYDAIEAGGFSGRGTGDVITSERMLADLRSYSPQMGIHNRDLAIGRHEARDHAVALVEALAASRVSTRAGADLPWRELGRLTRVMGRQELDLFALNRQLARMSERAQDAEARLRAVTDDHTAAQLEIGDMRAEMERVVAENDRRELLLDHDRSEVERRFAEDEAFRASRRFRFAAALAKPFDALRSLRR